MTKRLTIFLTILLLLVTVAPVQAQSAEELPIYIVQSGDSINGIAVRFGITSDALINANDISDPNSLNIGTRLRIPGIQGFSGTLTTDVAGMGATLTGLSREYQISPDLIVRLNRITSPSEIYVGSTLVLPAKEDQTQLFPAMPLHTGESLLELAVRQNENPWKLMTTNQLAGSMSILPAEAVFSATETPSASVFGSSLVRSVTISPLPIRQGKTEVITVRTSGEGTLTGELNGMPLHFFKVSENVYIAIQGIHALAPTGITNIALTVSAPGLDPFQLEQSVVVEPGYYPQDPALIVDPETIDPAVTKPEDDRIREIVTPATPERYWTGLFKQPVDDPACVKSWFGNRRSYNGSEYTYFHSGVDYGVCANLNIYAPAAGKVVFAEQVSVRGNATIIDHGWGIYSGIWHQSNSFVKVGDFVEAGQLIGEIGKTGRVTGPHLHWEVWANGIQVEPLDWLDHTYPEDFLPPQ